MHHVAEYVVTVSGDVAGVVTLPKQLPFAIYKMLNEVGERAQKNVIAALGHDLIIRNGWTKPGTRYGINLIYAKKARFEINLYTRADWLLEEEGFHGGVKTPDHASKATGRVPTSLAEPDIPHARPTKQSVMPRSQKAGTLLKNPKRTKAFIVTSKKNGIRLVLQRVGLDDAGTPLRDSRGNYRAGRKKERKGSKVVVKAILVPSVRVPEKKVFTTTAIKTMNVRHMNLVLSSTIRDALRSAKF
jgi:hypothetical protein